MATRIFLLGVVILFFGFQLRSFESFVLNERISSVINERAAKKQAQDPPPAQAEFLLFDQEPASPPPSLPKYRRISPPRWLGYSFLSIGAVLVCSCPLCRA